MGLVMGRRRGRPTPPWSERRRNGAEAAVYEKRVGCGKGRVEGAGTFPDLPLFEGARV